jgi:hypothetical protein
MWMDRTDMLMIENFRSDGAYDEYLFWQCVYEALCLETSDKYMLCTKVATEKK